MILKAVHDPERLETIQQKAVSMILINDHTAKERGNMIINQDHKTILA